MKNLIFLCIATSIFILSIIVLNVAPIINGILGKGTYDSNGEASSYGCMKKIVIYIMIITKLIKRKISQEPRQLRKNKMNMLNILKKEEINVIEIKQWLD